MDPAFWTALLLSFQVALLASLLLLLLGVPLAWVLAFRAFPGKVLVESLFLLPLVLPPTVLAPLPGVRRAPLPPLRGLPGLPL
jgi:molybdate transport system permease protein